MASFPVLAMNFFLLSAEILSSAILFKDPKSLNESEAVAIVMLFEYEWQYAYPLWTLPLRYKCIVLQKTREAERHFIHAYICQVAPPFTFVQYSQLNSVIFPFHFLNQRSGFLYCPFQSGAHFKAQYSESR